MFNFLAQEANCVPAPDSVMPHFDNVPLTLVNGQDLIGLNYFNK